MTHPMGEAELEALLGKVSRIYFRADAAFAMPSVYKYLEAERISNTRPPMRCVSSFTHSLQSRQFPSNAGDTRADQGLVADQLEGEADPARRQSLATHATSAPGESAAHRRLRPQA
jgi:hypothetical protein